MVKKLLLPLICISGIAMPMQAGWGEGFLLGGFAGLTTALVGTAIAKNCQPDVVVVEEPCAVYEQPYVVYEPQVVYEPRVYTRPCPKPAPKVCKRRCIAPQPAPKEIVKKTVVETRMSHSAEELKKRELALKEQQIELALLQEKKELLREKNKEKELDLKGKELEIKRLKTLEKNDKKEHETQTKTTTVTKSVN